jgi:hypothetical protein
MIIFKSESDLVEAINRHDKLVIQCSEGKISFWGFCEKYNNFYSYYALDGHESDNEEILLLKKHEDRIEPHKIIAEDVLGKVCGDDDAKRQIYIDAGRFGSDVALLKLKEISDKYIKEDV